MKTLVAKISVVIPLYNKSENIIGTINSILNQTVPPHEILVVDDGSTDGSAEIVSDQKWKDHRYSAVHLIRKENGGASSARNLGIEKSTGLFVAFIDADDKWEPHFLEEIQNLIDIYPSAVAYTTSYQKVNEFGDYKDPKIKMSEPILTHRLLDNYFEICAKGDLPFITSSICIPKSVLAQVGTFPVGEPIGEDQDLWSRLALAGKIAYSPKTLAFYHLDGENRICINNVPSSECGFSLRLHAAVNSGSLPPELSPSILKYTATHLLHLAKLNMEIGRFDIAEELLKDTRCHLLPVKHLALIARTKARQHLPSMLSHQ